MRKLCNVITDDVSEAQLAAVGRMALVWPWIEMAGVTLAQAAGRPSDTAKVMSASGGWLVEINAASEASVDLDIKRQLNEWIKVAREIKRDRESIVHGFLLKNNKRLTFDGDRVIKVDGEPTYVLTHWRTNTDRPLDLNDINRLARRMENHAFEGLALAMQLREAEESFLTDAAEK